MRVSMDTTYIDNDSNKAKHRLSFFVNDNDTLNDVAGYVDYILAAIVPITSARITKVDIVFPKVKRPSIAALPFANIYADGILFFVSETQQVYTLRIPALSRSFADVFGDFRGIRVLEQIEGLRDLTAVFTDGTLPMLDERGLLIEGTLEVGGYTKI